PVRQGPGAGLSGQFPPARAGPTADGRQQDRPGIIGSAVSLGIAEARDHERINRLSVQTVDACNGAHQPSSPFTNSNRPCRKPISAWNPSNRFAFSLLPPRPVIATSASSWYAGVRDAPVTFST